MRILPFECLQIRRGIGRVALFSVIAAACHVFIDHSSTLTSASSIFTDHSSVFIDRSSERARDAAPDESRVPAAARRSEPRANAAVLGGLSPADAPRLEGPGFSAPALAFDLAVGLPCPCTVPPPLLP
jgi:hypothetical protein